MKGKVGASDRKYRLGSAILHRHRMMVGLLEWLRILLMKCGHVACDHYRQTWLWSKPSPMKADLHCCLQSGSQRSCSDRQIQDHAVRKRQCAVRAQRILGCHGFLPTTCTSAGRLQPMGRTSRLHHFLQEDPWD
eukprot:SAG31_NODE_490_length_14932_cov_9.350300_7_plen_134_part_00